MNTAISNVLKASWFKWVVSIIAIIILLLLVFRMGVEVGMRRADFSLQWGRNYSRFFGEPQRGFDREFFGQGPMNAFGNAGTVLGVSTNTLAIQGNNGNEQSIAVTSATMIKNRADTITLDKIKAGDHVVVFGAPNGNGQIEARLIRVFDAAELNTMPSATESPSNFPPQQAPAVQ